MSNTTRHAVNADELAALSDAIGTCGPMACLGAVLGLRWGECAGLRVGRLGFLRSTLEVAEQLDLKTAQTRLGHSDPRLTLAVYAKATTAADAEQLGTRFMNFPRPARGLGASRNTGRSGLQRPDLHLLSREGGT